MNNLKLVVLGGVLAFTGLIFGCSAFVTVEPGARGIVTTMGKVEQRILDEGFHIVTPLVTKVYTMSVKIQKSTFNTSAASKDLQTVSGHIVVNWQIPVESVNRVFQEIGTLPIVQENMMNPAVNEIFKAITAQYSALEILTKRVELKKSLDDLIVARLSKYNIRVLDASIQDINFSEDFNNAIEAKQVAEQRSQQAKYEADKAAQEAQSEINRAKGKAESMRLMSITITEKTLDQQKLEIQMKLAEKWNGQLPQITGGGTIPFLDVSKLASK